jgi:hypothetical protein
LAGARSPVLLPSPIFWFLAELWKAALERYVLFLAFPFLDFVRKRSKLISGLQPKKQKNRDIFY